MALGGTVMSESGSVRGGASTWGARRQAATGKVAASLLGLLVVASLTACATAPSPQSAAPPPAAAPAPPPMSPQEALKARAERFWKARVQDDPAAQYELLPPEDRHRTTLTAYVRTRTGLRYIDYVIQEVKVSGNEGTVNVTTRFRLNVTNLPPHVAGEVARKGPWPSRVNDRWIMQDGVWYRPLAQSTPGAPGASRGGVTQDDFA